MYFTKREKLIPVITKIANFIVFSALIAIASCNGSPPHDSGAFCQGEPCLKASLDKGKVGYRVLLVGDAGGTRVEKENEGLDKAPVLRALENFAGIFPDRTAVVFLGDTIYPKGLPDKSEESAPPDKDCKSRACAEKRIDAQIDVLKNSGARGIFVPGNHDWDGGGRKGWNRINNLGKYIADSRQTKKANVDLFPKKGCPGPVTIPLYGDKVEIAVIALDTQWWLHEYKKPGKDDNFSECKQVTETGVLESLEKQIQEESNKRRHILLVAHHPLKSYGEHGAFYPLKDHARPGHFFQQLIRRPVFTGRQDLHHSIYKNMREQIEGAIQTAHEQKETPLVYAAGHDHSLQIIKDKNGMFHLVSGAGSGWNATRVGQGEGTLFSHSNRETGGFIAVDYLQSGAIRFAVIEPRSNGQECIPNGGNACVVFSIWAK
jgi:hypothetical protein